jgi:phage shock protein PspC (stress-responsive transcriptional regulator)
VLDERVHAAKADGRDVGHHSGAYPATLAAMPLADFLGWDSQDWRDTLGLVGVFFIAFPLLVHAIVGYIVASVIGERRENQALARGEDASNEG